MKIDDYTIDKYCINDVQKHQNMDIVVTGKSSEQIFIFSDLKNGGKLKRTIKCPQPVICTCTLRNDMYRLTDFGNVDFDDKSRPFFILLVLCSQVQILDITTDTVLKSKTITETTTLVTYDIRRETIVLAWENGTIYIVHASNVYEDDSANLFVDKYEMGIQPVHFISIGSMCMAKHKCELIVCTKLCLAVVQTDKVCRIKAKVNKYYTAAHLSNKEDSIIAYVDGTIDVFNLHPNEDKIRLSSTIDAHGAPITKLYIPPHSTSTYDVVTVDILQL